MEFQKLVEDLLQEDVTSGGDGSSFGLGVAATANQFSSDSYAPGDARTPQSIFGKAVLTRGGLKKTSKVKRKKKKSRKK
jgi:hypothetical protein